MSNLAKKLKTVDDLLAESSSERLELIGGEVVEKTAPSFDHSDAQIVISSQLVPIFRRPGGDDGTGGWWLGTEVLVRYELHQAFQHDIAGWRRDRVPEKLSGRIVEIVPDWACEILSTNRKRDLMIKKWVMQKHKVSYYWIVDLEAKILSVLHWSEKGYVEIQDIFPGKKARIAPFDAIELDVDTIFGADPV